MATFRKYGGTNYSPIANIVRHNMFNSKSSSFMTSGSYNSKENFLSHVDMSGNSLLHVGNIYFQDGTSISSGSTDPSLAPYGLASVLNNSTDGGGFNISNINDLSINGSLQIGGKTQTSTYSGFNIAGTYNNATLTFDTNGKITNVIDNSLNYDLGQGLDLSGASTLQVKSNLDFLTNVKIKNNDILNPALQIANVSETKKIYILCDLAGGSYNSITQPGDNGIISRGIDASTPCPLVLTTQEDGTPSSGIRITDNSVLVQADLNNYYDLSLTGHNFYGNMYLKTAGTYLQFPDGTQQTTAIALKSSLSNYSYNVMPTGQIIKTFKDQYNNNIILNPSSTYLLTGICHIDNNSFSSTIIQYSKVELYNATLDIVSSIISNYLPVTKYSISFGGTYIYDISSNDVCSTTYSMVISGSDFNSGISFGMSYDGTVGQNNIIGWKTVTLIQIS